MVEVAASSSDTHLGLPRAEFLADGKSRRAALIGLGAFAIVLLVGLTWAKWWPYSHKLPAVLARHTVGTSILTAGHAAPPAPSWLAATSFAQSYFKAIWMALVAALLIAAAVEAFLPGLGCSRLSCEATTGSRDRWPAACLPSPQ